MTLIVIKSGKAVSLPDCIKCHLISNPYNVTRLRRLDGRHSSVRKFVLSDPGAEKLLAKATSLVLEQGADTVSFGCTGGKHRSVALAEEFGTRMQQKGYQVAIIHRELS